MLHAQTLQLVDWTNATYGTIRSALADKSRRMMFDAACPVLVRTISILVCHCEQRRQGYLQCTRNTLLLAGSC